MSPRPRSRHAFPLPAFPRQALFCLLLAGAALPSGASGIGTSPRDHKFQAGQALTLEVVLDTAAFVNGGYPIDTAGYVDIPLAGRLYVHGKTPEELEDFLAKKLSNYIKDINIRATPCIRLTLLGHFVRQGQYYLSPHTTVWEAVKAAGGMAGERNLGKLHVLRGTREIEISVLDEYSRSRTLAAAGLESGDLIVFPVPRDNAGFWYWFKEILQVTTSLATVTSSILITYLLISDGSLSR